MIESEEKKERLTEMVTRWCNFTKVSPQLREGDIPSLVRQVIEEFYHIHLSCGHLVEEIDEGVHIAYRENDGSEVSGMYCKECAEEYKRTLGAWEVKDES